MLLWNKCASNLRKSRTHRDGTGQDGMVQFMRACYNWDGTGRDGNAISARDGKHACTHVRMHARTHSCTHAHMYSFMHDLDLRIFAHGNLCHDVWKFGVRKFISK